MAIQLIEDVIARFLSAEEPEVMSLSGHWGVGKTYFWNRQVAKNRDAGNIGLLYYSYVSLFGVNSIEDLKYSIFENTVGRGIAGKAPTLKTFDVQAGETVKAIGKKSLWFLQQLPVVKSHIGGLGPAWFLSVRKTIVCLDDIERRGNGLSIRDVMGLASILKEQKSCKVVLILNDDALDERGGKEEFRIYLEKVVDKYVRFEPSAEECSKIALESVTETNKLLAQYSVGLGISNIRVLRKISGVVKTLEPLLARFDEQVLKRLLPSVVLLAWSVFEPLRAPSIAYLKMRGERMLRLAEQSPLSEEESRWDALLESYDFLYVDEFDLVVLDGIQKGYFDSSSVERHAEDSDGKIRAERSGFSLREAWNPFHDSFLDNRNEVIASLYQAGRNNLQYMSCNGSAWNRFRTKAVK